MVHTVMWGPRILSIGDTYHTHYAGRATVGGKKFEPKLSTAKIA